MGKTNIVLTKNKLKFTIHNILLFPVVHKGMSCPEQKICSLIFFKKLDELSKFSKIKNTDIVLHEKYVFHSNRW